MTSSASASAARFLVPKLAASRRQGSRQGLALSSSSLQQKSLSLAVRGAAAVAENLQVRTSADGRKWQFMILSRVQAELSPVCQQHRVPSVLTLHYWQLSCWTNRNWRNTNILWWPVLALQKCPNLRHQQLRLFVDSQGVLWVVMCGHWRCQRNFAIAETRKEEKIFLKICNLCVQLSQLFLHQS